MSINTLHPSQRHLLLESLNKVESSFIANINAVALFVRSGDNIKNLNKVPELVDDYEEVKEGLANTDHTVLVLNGRIDNLAEHVGALEDIGIVGRFDAVNTILENHDSRIGALEAGGGGGGGGGDMSNYYTKLEVNNRLALKRNADESYSITQTNNLLDTKLNVDQGSEHAGERLVIDASGIITTTADPITIKWEELVGNPVDSVALKILLDQKEDKAAVGNGTLTIKDTTGATLAVFHANQSVDSTCIVPNGGGSGTTDYSVLSNKPRINGIELYGDKSNKDLKLRTMGIQAADAPNFISTNMPVQSRWLDVKYDSTIGRAIVVGCGDSYDSGVAHCYYSDDNGTVWRNIEGLDANPTSVAYGNGKWVIAHNGAYFDVSDDGITFVKKPVPSSGNWSKILFTGSKFIALNKNTTDAIGSIESIDGTTWTTHPNSGYTFVDAIYANGMTIILCKEAHTIVSSVNMESWVSHAGPAGNYCRLFFYDGKYIVTMEDTNKIYWSSNLVDWNEFTITSSVSTGFTAGAISENYIVLFQQGGTAFSCTDITSGNWSTLPIPLATDWNIATYGFSHVLAFGSYSGFRERAAVGTCTEAIIQDNVNVTNKLAALLGVQDIQNKLLNKFNSVYFDYNVITKTFTPTAVSNVFTISPNYPISTLTVPGNCMITLGEFDAGYDDYKAAKITLLLTNGGSYNVIWNSNILWPGGTAPTLTPSGTDMLTFITPNGGVSWFGTYQLDMKVPTV